MRSTIFTTLAASVALALTLGTASSEASLDVSNVIPSRRHHAKMIRSKIEKRSFTGKATFYHVATGNAGACGSMLDPSEHVVALNQPQFGNLNEKSSWCGKTITISNGLKQTTAKIMDACPTSYGSDGQCAHGGLDMSTSLFQFFEPLGVGVFPITWWEGGSSDDDDSSSSTTSSKTTKQKTSSSSSASSSSSKAAEEAAAAKKAKELKAEKEEKAEKSASASKASVSAAAHKSSVSAAKASSISSEKHASSVSSAKKAKASKIAEKKKEEKEEKKEAAEKKAKKEKAAKEKAAKIKAAKQEAQAHNIENFADIMDRLDKMVNAALSGQ